MSNFGCNSLAELAGGVAGEIFGLLKDNGIYTGTLEGIKNADPGVYGVYERSVSDWTEKFGTLIVWGSKSTNYKGWLLMALNGQSIVVGGSGGYRTLNI